MVIISSFEEKAEFLVLNSDIWWDLFTAAPNAGGRESAQNISSGRFRLPSCCPVSNYIIFSTIMENFAFSNLWKSQIANTRNVDADV